VSVIITISDDGHVEATHNSGRVLWSMQLGEFAESGFSESIANWIGDAIRMYANEPGDDARGDDE